MAYRFGIRFDVNDFRRWSRAVLRIKRRVIGERNNLPRDCAIEYYQLVYRNIMNQRYSGTYEPYNERYAVWKQKVVGHLIFWRLYDAVLRNLRFFRVQGDANEVAYMGGIDNNSYASDGKSIAMYATAVEEGNFGPGTRKKPRPVFWPTGLEYARKSWKERNYESLNKLMDTWR